MVQSYMVNLSQYTCPVGITITGRISNSSPLSAVCVVDWRWKVEKTAVGDDIGMSEGELWSTFCSAPCRHASLWAESDLHLCVGIQDERWKYHV